MTLQIANKTFESRLLLGTALYPSPEIMCEAIKHSSTEIITVSLRRQAPNKNTSNPFWDMIKDLGHQILPNTAGCKSAKEAITTAQMAREIFGTNWIKLEVIGDDYNLQPDPFELLIATKELIVAEFCAVSAVITEQP